jgi:hypothetical protein
MYALVRRARLSGGNLRAAMAWAAQVTEHVTQTTGTQCGLWNTVYSQEAGSISWNAMFADLTALEGFIDKLRVDDSFSQLTETGIQYVLPGSINDQLSTMIHPTDAPDPRRYEYSAVVESTLLPGKMAEGLALGVEIAQMVERLSGVPSAFMINNTGNYGGVTWATIYSDAAEMDRAEQAVNTNPEFVQLIDERASRCFAAAPGQATQRINRRVL